MTNDKQHEALEKIFQFLKAHGRKDLVDEYFNASKRKEKDKICVARKKWRCCKCYKPIIKGEKYRSINISTNTSFVYMRYCLNCQPGEEQIHFKEQQSAKLRFISQE